ncbi:MAG TPA: hypothetical protein V6D35_19680 [Candidatus Sericytochromatia bacterium]|jgi:hypothetical protein
MCSDILEIGISGYWYKTGFLASERVEGLCTSRLLKSAVSSVPLQSVEGEV